VNELAEGNLGRANGLRAGEGPVGGRADGMSVVIFLSLTSGLNRSGASFGGLVIRGVPRFDLVSEELTRLLALPPISCPATLTQTSCIYGLECVV